MKTAIVAKIVIGTLITITGTAAPIVYSAARNASSNGSSSDLSSFFSSLFSSSSQSAYPEMTLSALAAYDGLNGNLAYVAVNGLVYNVTNAASWSNGTHKGMHLAGTDASVVFASSPHELTILQQLPIVGMIVTATSSETSGSSSSSSSSGDTSSCSWIEIEDDEDEEEDDDAINLPFLANGEDSEDDEDDEHEYYYSCDISSTSSSTTTSTTSSSTASSEVAPVTFTLVTLAPYDGLNGHLAYVAVHGNVYNVTNAAGWSAGTHRGMHLAGTDATAVFDASPHELSILIQLPIVGTLVA